MSKIDIEQLLKKFQESNLIGHHLYYLENLDQQAYQDEILSETIPEYEELMKNIEWGAVFKGANESPSKIAVNLINYLSIEFNEAETFLGEEGLWCKKEYDPNKLFFIIYEVVIPVLKLIWNNDKTEHNE